MKRLIAILLCCFLLAACTPNVPGGDLMQTEPVLTESAPTETQSVHGVLEFWMFYVYRGNENADGLLAREVLVPQLTPEVVMAELIKAGVVPGDTVVNSLEKDGTQLNIDFNEAFMNHLCTMGTSGEMILVSSVVNTFLSAFDAESVMFTVNGETVESGHVIYDFPLTFSDNVVYEIPDIIEE